MRRLSKCFHIAAQIKNPPSHNAKYFNGLQPHFNSHHLCCVTGMKLTVFWSVCFQNGVLSLLLTSWGTFLPYPAGTLSTRQPSPLLWAQPTHTNPSNTIHHSLSCLCSLPVQSVCFTTIIKTNKAHCCLHTTRFEKAPPQVKTNLLHGYMFISSVW